MSVGGGGLRGLGGAGDEGGAEGREEPAVVASALLLPAGHEADRGRWESWVEEGRGKSAEGKGDQLQFDQTSTASSPVLGFSGTGVPARVLLVVGTKSDALGYERPPGVKEKARETGKMLTLCGTHRSRSVSS